MSAPAPDELGLGRFEDYAARLSRATLRPSVDVGDRVPRELVVELVRALGHDPDWTAAVHIEDDVVSVVTVPQPVERCHGEIVTRTTEHRIEP
jgi:hypothetical protein